MKVAVVGAGVAGRAAASLLLKSLSGAVRGPVSVTLFEQSASPHETFGRFFTGLWSPALDVIDRYLDIPLPVLLKNAVPVTVSGYRSQKTGDWLVQPALGLQSPLSTPHRPSLCFINNTYLMDLLEESIKRQAKRNTFSDVQFQLVRGANIVGISENSNKNSVNLLDDSGKHYEANVILAADGMFSTIRSHIYGQESTVNFLEHRGYRVYRGGLDITPDKLPNLYTNESSDKRCIIGFQTWGMGSRFAVVPTGPHRIAWFAAITSKSIDIDRLHNEWRLNQRLTALNNGGEPISSKVHDYLKSFYSTADWHKEIADIVSNTNTEDIIVHEAVAFKKPFPGGLSVIHYGENNKSEVPVFFLGDAAHTVSQKFRDRVLLSS